MLRMGSSEGKDAVKRVGGDVCVCAASSLEEARAWQDGEQNHRLVGQLVLSTLCCWEKAQGPWLAERIAEVTTGAGQEDTLACHLH